MPSEASSSPNAMPAGSTTRSSRKVLRELDLEEATLDRD